MISFTYLVRISEKYEVDTSRLLECVRTAWIKGESSYDDLLIRLRQRVGNEGVFLITQDEKIVAQVRLTSKLLESLSKKDVQNLQLEDYRVAKQNRSQPEDLMIKDLKSGVKRFNLEGY